MLGSLDHSPSEQLGHPDQWHTSVLILSRGGEHWDLARKIASDLRSKDNLLRQWSARHSASYKLNFENALVRHATSFPVHIRAISAKGEVIQKLAQQMARDLGLADNAVINMKSGKPYVTFGPFAKSRYTGINEDGQLQYDTSITNFELPANQAIPLIFICNFVIATHREALSDARDEDPSIDWLDLQLMPNKFPGGIDGRMAAFFNAIMSNSTAAHIVAGNIRVVTLLDRNGDQGSTLADNLAGLLDDKLTIGNVTLPVPEFKKSGSSFLWRILGTN